MGIVWVVVVMVAIIPAIIPCLFTVYILYHKYVFNVLLCKQMHGITYRHRMDQGRLVSFIISQSEDAVL